MLDTIWLALAAIGVATNSPQWIAVALHGRLADLHQDRCIFRAQVDVENYQSAVRDFKFHCGRYPTTQEGLEALIHEPLFRKGWRGPYVKTLTVDPWGHPYLYKRPGAHNPRDFDLYSLGPDGVESKDDIGNWPNRPTGSR